MTVDIKAPGLRNIIQEIRKNPKDTLLAERFLSLCSDLADQDDDKLVALLIYADILSELDYKKSLSIAYQIYLHSPVYDEIALELIADIFQKIGKKESSDTVLQELQKLIERKQIEAKTALIPPSPAKNMEVEEKSSELKLMKPAALYLEKDAIDLKIRFKMSDVVESEEKLMEALLYDLISKKQYEDAEDLLEKIDKQFPQRFWAQKARDSIQENLRSSVKEPLSVGNLQEVQVKKNSTDFSSWLEEVQRLMGERQHRRAFLKIRRFVLEEIKEIEIQDSDLKSVIKALKECTSEQGLLLPRELLQEKISIQDLRHALSRRLEQKLQNVLV